MTLGLSSLGKIRGHFIISKGPQPIETKLWSVSRQPCLFASFHENGCNPNTQAGQRPDLFNHLEARLTTAAVRQTCHSQFAKDPGPGASLGRMYSQIDTWVLGEPVRSTKQDWGSTLARCSNGKAHSPRETPAQKEVDRERKAGVQVDSHLRPCLTMCSSGCCSPGPQMYLRHFLPKFTF